MTNSDFKGYTGKVFYRECQGSFKVSGWCYQILLHGECVRAGGGLATQEKARAEAKSALLWDIQQRSK